MSSYQNKSEIISYKKFPNELIKYTCNTPNIGELFLKE